MFTIKPVAVLFVLLPLAMMEQPLPTITMFELSKCIELKCMGPHGITVLTGLLSDVMDLMFSNPTDYTTGKRILPMRVTIEDVNKAQKDPKAPENIKSIFRKMQEKYERADFTPEPVNLNSTLTPVLQFVNFNATAPH